MWRLQISKITLQLVYDQKSVSLGQTKPHYTWHFLHKPVNLKFSLFPVFACCFLTDNTQNIYRVSPDGSLRVTFASGMEITLNTEPHILAGVVSPTLGKCNISLPGEHNSNLIEWRQRREQTKGNISTFERRLRVRFPLVWSAVFPLKAIELKSCWNVLLCKKCNGKFVSMVGPSHEFQNQTPPTLAGMFNLCLILVVRLDLKT